MIIETDFNPKLWLKEKLGKYYALSNDVLDFIVKNGHWSYLQPKELFLESGCVVDKIGLLKSGILRACQISESGNVITNYFYHLPDNDIVTLLSSFNNNVLSEHCVEAITESSVFYMNKLDIQAGFQKHRSFETLARIIAENQYLQVSQRINEIQTKSTHELYLGFFEKHKDLIKHVPQNMISSYLGMSQYTYSKTKTKLK